MRVGVKLVAAAAVLLSAPAFAQGIPIEPVEVPPPAIEFTAPAAGDYPYMCTFPGHGAIMKGVMKVQ